METVDRLRAAGLEVRSLDECLDTNAAAGELMLRVFDAIAYAVQRLMGVGTLSHL